MRNFNESTVQLLKLLYCRVLRDWSSAVDIFKVSVKVWGGGYLRIREPIVHGVVLDRGHRSVGLGVRLTRLYMESHKVEVNWEEVSR